MRDFRKLKVWYRSHNLALAVYQATQGFPRSETYGLTSQIRRAAASVPANIAEGYGRDGTAELARFLGIASGSSSELEYHLLLARDLGFVDERQHGQLEDEVRQVKRMLTSLMQRLRKP